jgi:hypothetical protein
MAGAGPGRRPAEWWITIRVWMSPLDDQAEILVEMGELTKSELKRLMTWWRMDYETNRPRRWPPPQRLQIIQQDKNDPPT